ncbi:MAG: hypothetical protein KF819_17545 [Labilithrix sp.]|nr:hypothetical protein [Labilithrix sp.]
MRARRWMLFLGLASASGGVVAYGCSSGSNKPPAQADFTEGGPDAPLGATCTETTRIPDPDMFDGRGSGGIEVMGTINLARALPAGTLIRVDLIPVTFPAEAFRIPQRLAYCGGGQCALPSPPSAISIVPSPTTVLKYRLRSVKPGTYFLRFSSASRFYDNFLVPDGDGGALVVGVINEVDEKVDHLGYYAPKETKSFEEATAIKVEATDYCQIDFAVDTFVCLGANGADCKGDIDCRGHVCENKPGTPFIVAGSCDVAGGKCKSYWDHCGATSPMPDGGPFDTDAGDLATAVAAAGMGPEGVCTGRPEEDSK